MKKAMYCLIVLLVGLFLFKILTKEKPILNSQILDNIKKCESSEFIITDLNAKPLVEENYLNKNDIYILPANGECEFGASVFAPHNVDLYREDKYLITNEGGFSPLAGDFRPPLSRNYRGDQYAFLSKTELSAKGKWVIGGKNIKEKLSTIKLEEIKRIDSKDSVCANLDKNQYEYFYTYPSKLLGVVYYKYDSNCDHPGKHLYSSGTIDVDGKCEEVQSGEDPCNHDSDYVWPSFALKIAEEEWLISTWTDVSGEEGGYTFTKLEPAKKTTKSK